MLCIFIGGFVVGYLVFAMRILPQKMIQGQVKVDYQLLLNEWASGSTLFISEPIPFPGYGGELDQLKRQTDEWETHPYHTTLSFFDILSASPEAIACCEQPEVGKEVRFLTISTHDSSLSDLLIMKNGNVILGKSTIHIPSMAWGEEEK